MRKLNILIIIPLVLLGAFVALCASDFLADRFSPIFLLTLIFFTILELALIYYMLTIKRLAILKQIPMVFLFSFALEYIFFGWIYVTKSTLLFIAAYQFTKIITIPFSIIVCWLLIHNVKRKYDKIHNITE